MDDIQKQALMKLIANSQPQMNTVLGIDQGHPNYKQMAENIGISGAPASQLQGLSNLFVPSNTKYNGLGGVSDNKMGYVSPTAGQPALNRASGPLDVSPSGVAGEAASMAANPNNYISPGLKTGMGSVTSEVQEAWPNLKKVLNPEEYSALLRKDPKVQEFLDQEAKRGTVPTSEDQEAKRGTVPTSEDQEANELARNKSIIGSGKQTGEDTAIIEEKPEDDEEDTEE